MSKLGAAPISAPGWTGKPREGVAIVDCDVHHNFRHPEQLLPYLSTPGEAAYRPGASPVCTPLPHFLW